MRQLIEGKLRSDYVQVVVKECSLIEATLALVDEDKQFLVTDRQTRPRDEELKSVLEENSTLKDKLTGVQVELAQEQETVEALKELAKCKEQEGGDLATEVESLKLQLREQEKKSKHMWRLQCMQAQEQEDLIARQQREIQHLKGISGQSESPPVVELDPLGADSGRTTSHQAAPDLDGPVATTPAISPPLPLFPGEALPSSPPQVVQPVL